jgi:hypothetical protein
MMGPVVLAISKNNTHFQNRAVFSGFERFAIATGLPGDRQKSAFSGHRLRQLQQRHATPWHERPWV